MLWRWASVSKTTGGQFSQAYLDASDTHGYCGLGTLPVQER